MTCFVLDARTATPHFPGIGRYVSNLACAMTPLLAPGERLTVICDPAYPIRLPPAEAVRMIPLAVSPFSLRQQWMIPRLLRDLQQGAPSSAVRGPSSIVYHSPYIAMPYLPGMPTVLTVYDLIPLRYPAHSTARARLFIRGMTRLALRAAQQIIAISEFTRNDFMAEFGLPPERITSAPLAADPTFRPQAPEAIAGLRARYSLPERFILYLGSNKPHKNLVRLVEAWQKVNRQMADSPMADCTLVIAGAWDERYPEAKTLALTFTPALPSGASSPQSPIASPQSIIWLGPMPEADLPALYSAATAFVFPSLYEGFGLPVLEAMACGTPVICSDTSSLPEVAGQTFEAQRRQNAKTPSHPESSQSGKSGPSASHSSQQAAAILVNPTDTDALAAAIARLVTDEALRRALAQRGLIQAARFSWERTAATTLELYRRLAAETS